MLYVLLLLLKILGILLLLFIGLVLLVLLTPIQYSFELEKEEQREPKFMVRVTWLFWLFYFKRRSLITGYVYWGIRLPGISRNFLKNRKNGKKRSLKRKKQKKNVKQQRHRQREKVEA